MKALVRDNARVTRFYNATCLGELESLIIPLDQMTLEELKKPEVQISKL